MTKKSGKSGLPIQLVIDAHQAFQDAVTALNVALGEHIESTQISEDEREALVKQLPSFDHSWRPEGELQKTIDWLVLETFQASLRGIFDNQAEMYLHGIYDDETGHYLNYIAFGPLHFDSEGGFIWIEDGVLALLSEREIFARFVERFGSPDDWSDIPAAAAMALNPMTIDDGAARAGIREVCERYQHPTIDPVAFDDALAGIFKIADRISKNCAPLPEESSMSLSWMQGRCR